MSQAAEHTRGNGRTITVTMTVTAVGAAMLAAAVCVLLGEKGVAVSPFLWSAALDFCRAVTGLFGLLAIVSAVAGRRSGSDGDGAIRSVVGGVMFIAAAVAGLGLVIVINGLAGLGLLYVGGALAVGSFRPSHTIVNRRV